MSTKGSPVKIYTEMTTQASLACVVGVSGSSKPAWLNSSLSARPPETEFEGKVPAPVMVELRARYVQPTKGKHASCMTELLAGALP